MNNTVHGSNDSRMHRLCQSVSLSLVALLLGSCIYIPPYYEEPYTPGYWFSPPPPPVAYPERRYFRRHFNDEPSYRRYYPSRDEEDYRPSDAEDDRRRPGDGPDSRIEQPGTEVVPPSGIEPPSPNRGSKSQKDSTEIPVATKGSKPGRVKLPFPPYAELDVSGMSSGSLAKDPTTGKVFRLP